MRWGVNRWIIIPHRREADLKQQLHEIRKAIDLFANDQQNLPQSLDDLVKQGYLREIPIDPITLKKDWVVEFGETTLASESRQGVIDLHSAAVEVSANGVPYNDF